MVSESRSYGYHLPWANLKLSAWSGAYPEGNHFVLTLQIGGVKLNFRSEGQTFVTEAVEELRKAIDDFGMERTDEAFVALKHAAEAAGRAIFNGTDDRPSGDDGAAALAHLFRVLRVEGIKILYVDGGQSDLIFPWDLLFHPDTGWLGETVMVLPTIEIGGDKADVLRDEAGFYGGFDKPKPVEREVGYAEDGTLPSAKDGTELAVVVEFAGDVKRVDDLKPLPNGAFAAPAKEKLDKWLAKPRQVWHFNTHTTEPSGRRRFDQCLKVSEMALLPASAFVTKPGFYLASFVFINACASAGERAGNGRSFGLHFIEQRAAGVCCTTAPVYDDYATRFAGALYDELKTSSDSLLAVVMRTRTTLLREDGHPLALLYIALGGQRFSMAA